MCRIAWFLALVACAAQGAPLLIRTGTFNGEGLPPAYYDRLDIALSADGTNWQRISTAPVLAGFARDASVVKRGDEFVTVYTDAFNSTNGTFGLARSTDLVQWAATNVRLKGPLLSNAVPNNTWAPEWFVDGERYFVLVRLSTQPGENYGAPGIGYSECLDPGIWSEWSDFTPLLDVSPTVENDPCLVKVGGIYHLFTDHSHYNRPGNHVILHRTSSAPFSGYSSPSVIGTDFTNAPAFVASGVPAYTAWEGQYVLPLGGGNYRLYFQAALQDRSFCIDSTNGMESWDPQTMRALLCDGKNAYGHGSVISIDANGGLPSAAVASYVARAGEQAAATISRVQANPQSFGLYGPSEYSSNRVAGRADVLADPAGYGLYTTSSIMDLRLGGLMLRKKGSNATVTFQPQTTPDLVALPFTNSTTAITREIPMPDDKGFLRVRVAPVP